MNRTALIDGDVLAYQFAFPNQQTFDWGDGVVSTALSPREAAEQLDHYVEQVTEAVKASTTIIALSDPKANWRLAVLPTYKHTRKKADGTHTERPKLYTFLRKYMQDQHNVYQRATLEGDDVLGILSTSERIIRGDKVIVSIDKDFYTIPGKFARVDVRTGELHKRTITVTEADYYHLYQTLTGDAVDGYSGCPGIGPKRATAILENAQGDLWAAVVAAYAAKGLTEEDALVQARVARICRAEDYDFSKKEVRLWTPSIAG